MFTVCAALKGKCRRRQVIVSTATSLLSGGHFSRPSLCLMFFLAQCYGARKLGGIEGSEVLDCLPNPNGMDWKAELGRNCDKDSAPRRAVELGHHQTGHPGFIL